MSENIENNIENQEISEQIEIDRRAKLQLWTTEKYKEEFKSFEGATDNEKLINILEIANKYKDKVDSFSIKNDIDVIERAFKSISIKFANIQDTVNIYEEDLVKSNMEQLIEIKDSILKEEILNAKIIQIEKERDTFEERLKKEESMLISCQNRVKELEESNRSLTQKNSDLVHSESNCIKLIAEKDKELEKNNKKNEKEIIDLNNKHKIDLEAKDKKINELELDIKSKEKQHEKEIVKLDKEKLKISGEVDKYKELLEISKTNLENSKLELEGVRTKHKEEIEGLRETHKKELEEIRNTSKEELKELRNSNTAERKELIETHKAELQELQLQVKEANKEEVKAQSKVEILEDSIKGLKEQKETLEGQLKALENKLRTMKEDLELQEETIKQVLQESKDKDIEINNLKEQLKKKNNEIR